MSDSDEEAKLAEVKAVLRRLQRIAADGDRLGPDASSWTKPADRAGSDAGSRHSVALPPQPGASASTKALNDALRASTPPEAAPEIGGASPAVAVAASGRKREGVSRLLVVSGLLIGGLAATVVYYRQQAPAVSGVVLDTSLAGAKGTAGPIAEPNVKSAQAAVPVEMKAGDTQVQVAAVTSQEKISVAPEREPTIEDVLRMARTDLDAGRVQAARTTLLAKETGGSPEVALLLARTYDPTVLAQVPHADAQPSSAEAAKWYRAWHERSVAQGQANPASALERLLRSLQ